jgi:hypothetical protein
VPLCGLRGGGAGGAAGRDEVTARTRRSVSWRPRGPRAARGRPVAAVAQPREERCPRFSTNGWT